MKIYLDLIFIINFFFDFLLIISVNIVLKRNIKLRKAIFSSLIGALSIFSLFIKFNSFTLFLFKVIISILMIISAFNYKDKKYFINNFITLYILSFILGGFLYYLNIEFSYKHIGLVFFNKGLSINVIILFILSPVILYIYIRQSKFHKLNVSNYYKVDLYYKKKIYKLNAYLDTGNNLIDPYKKRPINILYSKNINIPIEESLLVPYETVNGTGLLKCIVVDKLVIDNKTINKALIGITNNKFKIDGIDFLLNNEMEKIL